MGEKEGKGRATDVWEQTAIESIHVEKSPTLTAWEWFWGGPAKNDKSSKR